MPSCWGSGLCGIIFQLRGSVLPFGFQVALPCALLTMFIKVMEIDNLYYFQRFAEDILLQPAAYTGFSGLLGFLVVFRTSQAYNRYWTGATLVRQMGGSWFEAASSLVAFCRMSKCPEAEISAFQRNIIRLFSLIHALALAQLGADREEEGSVTQRLTRLEIIDGSSINKGTFEKLAEEECSIELVFNWIQALSIDNISTGVLVVPPPILTRAFAELSDGMVKFHEGMKICLHPFPFPYSQTTLVLLLLHWMIMPMVATQWTKDPLLAGFFSFLMVFIFWSLFGIASELENPFGDDANDINADEMQAAMNQRLHMILSADAANIPGMPARLKENNVSVPPAASEPANVGEIPSRTSSKNTAVNDPRQHAQRTSIGGASLWDTNDESMDACFSDKGMVSNESKRSPRKPNDVRGRAPSDVESSEQKKQIREEGNHANLPPTGCLSARGVGDCSWKRPTTLRDIRYDAQEHVVRPGDDSRNVFMPEWQEDQEAGLVNIAHEGGAPGNPMCGTIAPLGPPKACSTKVLNYAPPGRRENIRGASPGPGVSSPLAGPMTISGSGSATGGSNSSSSGSRAVVGGVGGKSGGSSGLGQTSPSAAGTHLVHPSLCGQVDEEEEGMHFSICNSSEPAGGDHRGPGWDAHSYAPRSGPLSPSQNSINDPGFQAHWSTSQQPLLQ